MEDDFISGIEHHFDSRYFETICRLGEWFVLKRFVKKSYIKGRENTEQLKGSQVLYVGNHLSHYDYMIQTYNIWALGLPIPRIAARANVFTPRLGKIWKKCGAFRLPFTKINRKEARALKKHIGEILDSGASVMVYPEGGRSYDGTLKPFHLGVIKYVFESAAEKSIPMLVATQHIAYSSVIEAPYFDEIQKHKKKQDLKKYLETDLRAFHHRFKQNFSPFTSNSVTHTFGEPFPLLECPHPRDVGERARERIIRMEQAYQREVAVQQASRARSYSPLPALRRAGRYLTDLTSYLG